MKVSILVTTYNLEKYIEQTLESILQQDYSDYEILVGDDGSTDKTVEIVKSYIDRYPERIRLFQMPRETGVEYNKVVRSAENRLTLWAQAKGEYCSFLDGDDYYSSPDRISKMVTVLESPENRDCIMCAHNLSLVYEDGTSTPLCRAKKEQKFSVQQYWELMFLQANALLFRNVFAAHPPEGALAKNFDDNNITYYLFQFGKMYYLPDCMGAYRQLSGSSWNSNDALKKACSNMIGYSIELMIAPENRKLSLVRHYPDFQLLYAQRDALHPESAMPFYQTAKEQNLTMALAIYEYKESRDGAKNLKRLKNAGRMGYYLAKFRRAAKKMLGRY